MSTKENNIKGACKAPTLPKDFKEFKEFRYGDMVIECRSCGKDTILKHPSFTNVEVAVQLPPFYTNNQHVLGLACEHCGNQLLLKMVEAVSPPPFDTVVNYIPEIPNEAKVTWKAGKDVTSFSVFLKEEKEQDEKELKEVEEGDVKDGLEKVEEGPKYILQGATDKGGYTLKVKEGYSYTVRIDALYDKVVHSGEELHFRTASADDEAYKEGGSEDDQDLCESAAPDTDFISAEIKNTEKS